MAARYRVRTPEDLVNAPRDAETGHYNLRNADLEGANLQGINLEGVNLQDANLRRAQLQGANLENAELERADFRGANLTDANLSGAIIWETNFQGANLRTATLENADLVQADFSRANLTNANLHGTNIRDTSFEDANLTNIRGQNRYMLRPINPIGNARITIIGGPVRQRPIPVPPPIPAMPPAPIPIVNNQDNAFNIHNAFDKIDVFDLLAFFESKIENGAEIGIQIREMTDANFLILINEKMTAFLSHFTPEELNSIPSKPENYYPPNINSWSDIWNYIYRERLTRVSFIDVQKKQLIGLSIYYVSKQPVSFQTSYALC